MPKIIVGFTMLFCMSAPAQMGGYGTNATAYAPADPCLRSICGDPKTAGTFSEQDMDRTRALVTSTANDFRTLQFSASVEAKLKQLAELEAAQQKFLTRKVSEGAGGDGARLHGVALAFYNMIQVSPLLQKVKYVPEVKDGKVHVTIDEKITREALKESSKADQDFVLAIANQFISSMTFNGLSDSDLEQKPITISLRILHPGLSDSDALKAESGLSKKNLAKIRSLSPLERGIYLGSLSEPSLLGLLEKIEKGTSTESEARSLVKWNKTFAQTFASLGNPESPLYKRASPLLSDIVRSDGGEAAILKFLADQDVENQAKVARQLQSCRIDYAMNEGLLPSDEQSATTRRDVETSKAKITAWIRRTYPASIQQTLIDAESRTDFAYAPSKSQFEREFEASIDRRLKTAKDNAATMVNVNSTGIRQIAAAIANKKKPANSTSTPPGTEKNEYCDSFRYPMLTDANYTSLGAVTLSRSTMTARPSVRETIINHELGHSVSKAIRALANDSTFERYRVCLNSTHPVNASLPADLNVEEDFADAVAEATTDPQMKQNPWCALLTPTYDQKAYADGGTDSQSWDPHSSISFRLLSFEFVRHGQLTTACNELVAKSPTPAKFRSCLKSTVASTNAPATVKSVK
jgi:hypothetical protein